MIVNSLKYFTASWCGPCKLFKPHILKLKDKSQYNIEILDSDLHPHEFKKYKVSSIPYLVFEDSDGNVFYQHRGAIDPLDVENILKQKVS